MDGEWRLNSNKTDRYRSLDKFLAIGFAVWMVGRMVVYFPSTGRASYSPQALTIVFTPILLYAIGLVGIYKGNRTVFLLMAIGLIILTAGGVLTYVFTRSVELVGIISVIANALMSLYCLFRFALIGSKRDGDLIV